MGKKKAVTGRPRRTRKRPPPKPETNGAIHDTELVFEVQGGKYDGETIRMDCMMVKLTSEQLERKHKLELIDGRYQATAGFADDLTKALEGLGYHATPAIAIRAWIAAADRFAELQKKTR